MTNQEAGAALPIVERVARAMQRENRPSNDCRNSDQREADEDASFDGYKALARTALEASYHAELVVVLNSLADAARSACDARRHPPLTEALFDADALLAKLEAGDSAPRSIDPDEIEQAVGEHHDNR
jgi:hypothetical protein